jgi:hypothetical protein
MIFIAVNVSNSCTACGDLWLMDAHSVAIPNANNARDPGLIVALVNRSLDLAYNLHEAPKLAAVVTPSHSHGGQQGFNAVRRDKIAE